MRFWGWGGMYWRSRPLKPLWRRGLGVCVCVCVFVQKRFGEGPYGMLSHPLNFPPMFLFFEGGRSVQGTSLAAKVDPLILRNTLWRSESQRGYRIHFSIFSFGITGSMAKTDHLHGQRHTSSSHAGRDQVGGVSHSISSH